MTEKEQPSKDAPLPNVPDKPIPDPPFGDDNSLIENKETDQAVDDILRSESDELLDVHDGEESEEFLPRERGFWGGIGHGLSAWWHNKTARFITLLAIFAVIAGVAAVPPARYWVLNNVGVRSSSSVIVQDALTKQPLKNVKVKLGTQTQITGSDGKAKFYHLKLGKATLAISRPGFLDVKQNITIGWGSNPQGVIGLKESGIQYTFLLKDYLTGKAVPGAEVIYGDAVARSDNNGKAVLALPEDPGEIEVTVSGNGYRTEKMTIKDISAQPVSVILVTNRKDVYINTQSGKQDVYAIDIDGKNQQIILAGSGSESNSTSLVASPDGSQAAVVSTRSGQRDSDGVLLNTLTLINLSDGSNSSIATAQQIKLIDWIGAKLVFEQISTNKSTAANARYVVTSYDCSSGNRYQLVGAPLLKAVLSAQGNIYYSAATDDDYPDAAKGFYKVAPDGSNKSTVLDKEVWNTYRTDYDVISVQTDDGWFAYNIKAGSASAVSAPSAYAGRLYIDGPSGKSLWVDKKDGQGNLMLYSTADAKNTTIHSQSGLVYPLRWLTEESVIYRVLTGNEAADYAISLSGAPTRKIADVVNMPGLAFGQ